MDDTTDDDQPHHWSEWPLCPQCRQRRQAICDSCQFAADDFPLADYLESVEITPIGRFENGQYYEAEPRGTKPQILLMCPRCEEAFPPRFYRVCQWCGHEFASGKQIENPLAEPLSPQAMWMIFGLVVFGVAALWWIMWVTSP